LIFNNNLIPHWSTWCI